MPGADGSVGRQRCRRRKIRRVSQSRQKVGQTSTTDGGCAKGMPRNSFTPLADVPTNVPWSSVTMGGVVYIVGAAKTVAVAAQMATTAARRKAMTIKENDWLISRGNFRHYKKEMA